MPEVTAVIPTRNRWPLVSTCLELVLGQEDVDLEVVVVDDGSTDGAYERLTAFADPRVRVCRHARSRGVPAARNTGIREARAPWVAFCDDDDLWAPRKLRTQLDALARAGADFCYGEALVLNVEASTVVRDQPAPPPDELLSRLLRANVVPGGCSNVVARTALVRELGGFDERLSQVEDWDLWLRLAERGRGLRCPEVLVAYRWHAENTTAQPARYARNATALEYFAAKHRVRYGDAVDLEGYSRWLARAAPTRRKAAGLQLSLAAMNRRPRELLRAVNTIAGVRPVERARRVRSILRRSTSAGPPVEVPDWLEPHRAATEDTSIRTEALPPLGASTPVRTGRFRRRSGDTTRTG